MAYRSCQPRHQGTYRNVICIIVYSHCNYCLWKLMDVNHTVGHFILEQVHE